MSKITTSRKTARTKPDLRPMRPMTVDEIEAAARSDPDVRPFSAAELARMRHSPHAQGGALPRGDDLRGCHRALPPRVRGELDERIERRHIEAPELAEVAR